MVKVRVAFIGSETNQLHDKVDELYEHLMDQEQGEALVVLEEIAEKVRQLKADLLTKED